MVKEDIFTFPVSTGTYQQFIDEILRLSEQQRSSYVCFANVHMVVEAYKDSTFNQVVRQADIVTPDGKPVALFLKLFKGINQVRVAGLDVFPDLLKAAEVQGKSIYFYGTTDDILSKIEAKARTEHPALNISGLYSPPFRTLSDEEKEAIINTINTAKPDLIFVALGCPKQENWMAAQQGKIQGCMLGLGHAFNVYAGIASRSPRWMQQLSLEWVYRLFQEPGRLWKRYFYTNSLFLLLTFRYFLTHLFSKRSGGDRKTTPAVYKCEYNITWLPLPHVHSLTDEMHDTLERHLLAICEQKGIAAKEINIHSQYVHVRLSVPPNRSVSGSVEYLKEKLGEKILHADPALRKRTVRNRVWEPGFLVTTDPFHDHIVQRYVNAHGKARL